jgi:hypothetical protein
VSLLNPTNTNEELIAAGYRRTSNRHRLISRIDREDWIAVLARHANRTRASVEETLDNGGWQDFYRRVLSQDTIELDNARVRGIPTSGGDPVGYVAYIVDIKGNDTDL